jgi:hypothetical protein
MREMGLRETETETERQRERWGKQGRRRYGYKHVPWTMRLFKGKVHLRNTETQQNK